MKSSNSPASAETLLALRRPLVIAHRGYSQLAPENTLPAFQLAKAAGADLIELDYHHSKDGVPVVIHDADLDRTTDARARWGKTKIRMASKTMEELRTLDAGRWFEARYAGTRISSLVEALAFIQAGNITLIERKSGDAATCVQLLRDRKLINRVIVQSFDWDYLKAFHQLEPRQILAALGPPESPTGKKRSATVKTLDRLWVDGARKCGARVVVWNRQITRQAVNYAQAQGLRVRIYTIDDPALANALLDLGVDGLVTNNPALLWRTLAIRATLR